MRDGTRHTDGDVDAAPEGRPAHRGNRHRRSEEARQAVLEAADDLLVAHGFAGLTIEGIAARAGVAKQTIYRWWTSKTEILMDAFEDDAAQLSPPDTGDLAQDLRLHLRHLADFLTTSDAGAVFRALAGQAQHDPTVATRLRAEHLNRQRDRDRIPLRRAMERGELPADTDVDQAVERLVSPVYYRVLLTGQPVPPEYTDLLVHQFLAQTKGL